MTDLARSKTSPEPAAEPAPSFGEELVRAHQGALWRWLRVLGARPDEAEDLAQETFVVLLRTPFVAQADGALRAWLRTTARNLFLAHCRRQRRTPIALDADAVERAFAAYERDDDGDGYRDALARCLETLPPRQHELLAASLRGEEPLATIAGRHELGVEALRSLLRRSKQALRDCVQRRLQR